MDFLQYIPHRPPFLFVDRVLEESDDTIRTEKKVDPKEPFFEGHYPGRPIMPGVLIFESIFQAGAILMGKRIANEGKIPVLTRVNNIKLKHAVHPGDTMQIEVKLKDLVSTAAYMTGKATVNGKTAVTLEFSAMLVEETK
ncbi:MAG: 3-hydroxyacyl-ACP dehydratase FabZ [Nitrospina sp.]|jgi:3-hydroxyacyl-[acyl-carrier-protein] dehydratase|nr:3-hydroxyacyl-ACP dehydratase FabZ [Nitrospina sp.]MBT3416025.1 3-hydroxyacyl-ACP dehydratase FabZ [Nitrospina sp.]MBT3855559.1 3-hydroxyacyl-ACP dehydratase FabZ [Nitrospina sp.]MBT4104749.1 3-hydroxyacyl-ACP dehydratase FabZ [Nitrospina sp.]MBT4389504.1 3-hydroxyacyl-ACP dehydratase FabZ [Nitrospina sp.]